MRRAIAIAFTGISLAGCSSFSLDSFKPKPPLVQVQLESAPPGADATTSLGPGCKTPCSVNVPAPDAGFAVTFALPKFLPVTVPVQVIRTPGDFTSEASTVIEPSPVFAELKPAGPPPKARKPMRPKPKKRKAAAAPATNPAGGSPFPAPAAAPATR
jgi:hypothetical protein